MDEKIKNLINEIIILKHNSDYRVSDILIKSGKRWEHSAKMILTNAKYNETILQKYLQINNAYKNINLDLFLTLIEKYNTKHNLPIPNENELVIHLRMGDVVVHNWFLNKNYIRLINTMLIKNSNINKITFVTCFAYQEWSKDSMHFYSNGPLWEYTEEKQTQNIKKITTLLKNIMKTFPNIDINIYSNIDIDRDICYCVLSKYFIFDQGGFSELLFKLNNLKNSA